MSLLLLFAGVDSHTEGAIIVDDGPLPVNSTARQLADMRRLAQEMEQRRRDDNLALELIGELFAD